jgi:hypothetical protein
MIFWFVLKLEISCYRVIIISWRILASFRGFFEDWVYFCMVKYLSFHNNFFFCLQILLKKVIGKATVLHTPCCRSLEVVLDRESFQIGCCSTAWLHASQSSPSKPQYTRQTQGGSIFYYYCKSTFMISWTFGDLMPWPKGTERAGPIWRDTWE